MLLGRRGETVEGDTVFAVCDSRTSNRTPANGTKRGREQRDDTARKGVSRFQDSHTMSKRWQKEEPSQPASAYIVKGAISKTCESGKSDPERRDHSQNTEEATLSTAKMAHRTHTGTFTSRVHWKTFRTEALVEQYGPPMGWNNEVNKSHDVASRQRMAVLLCQLSMYKET